MSHRQSLSLKKDQLNIIKGSNFFSKKDVISSNIKINLKNKNKILKSEISNQEFDNSQNSHFILEYKRNKKKSKFKKEKENLTKKIKVKNKKYSKRKKKELMILSDLNQINHPSRKLLIDINKKSGSLKNIATSLSQVHLNYIFSQKKSKDLGGKFKMNYLYMNQTPKNM